MTRTIASRSIGRGLGKIEVTSTDTLVAFAAKAGMTAADGSGDHSPFTAALLDNLATPGLDLRIAFGKVRDEVMSATDSKQEPYVYGSIGGSMVTLVPKPEVPVTKPVEPATSAADPLARDYEFAERIGTRQAWESFLAAHSSGFFADLARAARDKVAAAEEKFKRDEDSRLKAASEAAKRHAQEEAKTQAAEDVRLKAAAEARIKAEAEAEAKRKADADTKTAAEAEAKRKAEAEDRLKAEIEGRRKAALDAKLQAAANAKLKADEEARLRAELDVKANAADPAKSASSTVIALAPAQPVIEPAHEPKRTIDPVDLASLLQVQLKRVGCDPGALNGKWTEQSAQAMGEFNKRAKATFDVKVASIDALDAVKQQKARICPLVCGKGLKAEEDRCVATACGRGFARNKAGECEREIKSAHAPPSRPRRRRSWRRADHVRPAGLSYRAKKLPRD